ncbi:hypothetical protein J1N35_000989 [Gossypium stocksii]|uniref:Uncharacterized protein n=1 Tax=Gossypium stocksii TaxID=47602 RepID=A0A9D3WIH9_9ROSI|nr:hypothetical protein J1N35_000989 [Gossypium stocksii]
MPCASKEIFENKGPINESSVKRMTRGKDTPILKEAETNKTRKGKAKADSKRTNPNIEASLWHKTEERQENEDTIVEKEVDTTEAEVVEAEVVAEEE